GRKWPTSRETKDPGRGALCPHSTVRVAALEIAPDFFRCLCAYPAPDWVREAAMDALTNVPAAKWRRSAKPRQSDRPSRAEAEDAVRTLIRWAGDDPVREGLSATPARVVRAYEEWFSGYHKDPREYLSRTFEEISGYDEMVLLRNITFESHC